MKINTYSDKESWMQGRLGKITGSTLKDLIVKRGTGKKKGFYQIIADRIAIPRDDENRMDRGHRLEDEAIERFTEVTGKKVNTDLVIWTRDDNDNIAISPDGYIENKKKVTEAVEVKCLNSASHVEAIITGEYPKEYHEQILQYFVVNDDLETLYFVMYDPTVPKDYLCFTIHRADVAEEVQYHLDYEKQELLEIEEWCSKLTF
jgi:hypothetical protein